jgi:hypothetical protein
MRLASSNVEIRFCPEALLGRRQLANPKQHAWSMDAICQ